MDIERRYRLALIQILNGANLSDALDVRSYAGGVISMPIEWTAASISFYHSATLDGTYQPLYDDTGENLVILAAAASRDIVLPDALFACSFIKVWSQNAGAGQAQGATRVIVVSLKG